jgi:small ligand-binding sensory domain FIST
MHEQSVGARFGVGHAAAKDWRLALASALAQIRPLPAGANIAFVYFTDHFAADAGAIAAAVKAETGVEACLGTAGYGICATGIEYFDTPALALMVGVVPAGHFTVFDRPDTRPKGWFGVIHADPQMPALPEMLSDFGEATGGFLVGGLTSSRGAQAQIANAAVEGSVSGVMFDDGVPVITGLTQGCSPIGPAHRVTACEGNIAIELDGRSPFDVLTEEAGAALTGNLRRLGESIMVALPVSGADRPDYLVRHLVGVDPEGGPIAVAAMLEEGQSLMFCRRDAQAAAADLDRMLADLRRRAGAVQPRGALYYTCTARGPNLFGPDSAELKRIAAALGDVPLVGFFCAGEISNARLYGYTGVLSLFL